MTKAEKPGKRKQGRPPATEEDKKEPYQFRVESDRRARWRASAADVAAAGFEKTESEWARVGLDHWTEVCDCAVKAGIAPGDLLVQALEDRERSASVVEQIQADQTARALSAAEDRILRTLAPATWERLSRGGALTLAPKQRSKVTT